MIFKGPHDAANPAHVRSEEHTSELQSQFHLVCRLLLDPATTQIYPLSLHDALPISPRLRADLTVFLCPLCGPRQSRPAESDLARAPWRASANSNTSARD